MTTRLTLTAPRTDPELLALIEKAKNHVMTPEEVEAQRVSWVIGQMGLTHPEWTREETEARVREVLRLPPAGAPTRADLEAEVARLRAAAKALLDDVRRRYPGEKLRCPYMRALDEAVTASPASEHPVAADAARLKARLAATEAALAPFAAAARGREGWPPELPIGGSALTNADLFRALAALPTADCPLPTAES